MKKSLFKHEREQVPHIRRHLSTHVQSSDHQQNHKHNFVRFCPRKICFGTDSITAIVIFPIGSPDKKNPVNNLRRPSSLADKTPFLPGSTWYDTILPLQTTKTHVVGHQKLDF